MTAAVFQICNGDKKGKELKLPFGTFTFGRSHSCDVRLKNDDVSRMHCELRIDQAKVGIRDLQSRNGTHLNGCRLEEPATLSVGDRIGIGGLEFRLLWLANRTEPQFTKLDSEPSQANPNKMTLDELVQFDEEDVAIDAKMTELDDNKSSADNLIGNFGTTIFNSGQVEEAKAAATPEKPPQHTDATRDAARLALRKIFHGKS